MVAAADATAAADWSVASTRRAGRDWASEVASTPVPQPRSIAVVGIRLHPIEELEQEAGADVDGGAGESGAVRADRQTQVGVLDRARPLWARPDAGRSGCVASSARLLPRRCRSHLAEMPAQHLVHGHAHVLDPAAGEHASLDGGMAGDGGGEFVERGQTARQLHQHDAGAAEKLCARRHVPERSASPARSAPAASRRRCDRGRARRRAHPGTPGCSPCRAQLRGRGEGQRAVVVFEHHDLAGAGGGQDRPPPRRGSAGHSRRRRRGSSPPHRASDAGARTESQASAQNSRPRRATDAAGIRPGATAPEGRCGVGQ